MSTSSTRTSHLEVHLYRGEAAGSKSRREEGRPEESEGSTAPILLVLLLERSSPRTASRARSTAFTSRSATPAQPTLASTFDPFLLPPPLLPFLDRPCFTGPRRSETRDGNHVRLLPSVPPSSHVGLVGQASASSSPTPSPTRSPSPPSTSSTRRSLTGRPQKIWSPSCSWRPRSTWNLSGRRVLSSSLGLLLMTSPPYFQVSTQAGSDKAQSWGIPFFETSSKDDTNVDVRTSSPPLFRPGSWPFTQVQAAFEALFGKYVSLKRAAIEEEHQRGHSRGRRGCNLQ